jgi:ubiquinone/menaquinone biosynthesis C-methylase UbiE
MDIETEIQRKYYSDTHNLYNEMHTNGKDEHFFALTIMVAMLDFYNIKSILDIGSGTGRALLYIKEKRPNIKILGIEPVDALRQEGYKNGLSETELITGDAYHIQFKDEAFDLVCEFGMLHHVKKPSIVVSEMLRVSKMGIFISDSNNFGQGSLVSRSIKQLIDCVGLWKLFDFFKTKGKGYTISEGDGLAYSYSVFNNYKQIKKNCTSVHICNTNDAGTNHYRTASHICLLGIK